MKQIFNCGGGGLRIPTEDEVEVAGILLILPKIFIKSEMIERYSFRWGLKRKRSALVSKSEVSPAPEKAAAAVDAGESPSTPLCFLPSGSDGDDKDKTSSSGKKSLREARDDLVESYNRMQQEREFLLRETKTMSTLHKELTSANLELKAIIQKVNYSRNFEDLQLWNNKMQTINKQSYHPQITMFAPPTQQHCQQFMVDHTHNGGRFGMFNQIDPRVKIHGETYDFMASSQPLDQSKYLVIDNDLRARNAAAARKRRILRMKENKNALLALKLSSRGFR